MAQKIKENEVLKDHHAYVAQESMMLKSDIDALKGEISGKDSVIESILGDLQRNVDVEKMVATKILEATAAFYPSAHGPFAFHTVTGCAAVRCSSGFVILSDKGFLYHQIYHFDQIYHLYHRISERRHVRRRPQVDATQAPPNRAE